MRSAADDLRDELRHQNEKLDIAARIELALSLGTRDIAALAAARSISPGEARAIFERARAAGRAPSCANPDRA